MTQKIPLEWANRERLRLRLVGDLVALHDADGVIQAGRYVIMDGLGEIALMAEPKGAVMAEVETLARRAPAAAKVQEQD